jgi:hypothetical protein
MVYTRDIGYPFPVEMTIKHGTLARENALTHNTHSTCICSSRGTNMGRSGRYKTVTRNNDLGSECEVLLAAL